jgi:drug/metabolite transporter (DMT)-like permease
MSRLTDHRAGALLALMSAVFWGVSGACAQYLFEQRGLTIDWLVTCRLLTAGTLLLVYARLRGFSVWAIWRARWAAASILVFGIVGMLAVQYTYFAAIRYSNAATGTILQYVGPTLIAVYFVFVRKRLPTAPEAIAVGLAFLGTLLLVTHGDLDALQISPLALFWGLSSAAALAFYSIYPAKLLRHFPATVLVGWSMVIGALGFVPFNPPFPVPGTWDGSTFVAVGFIVFFGTLIGFYSYLGAVKRIGPEKSSLYASAEPLTAALVAVWWLGVPFGAADWLGAACIVATIFLLNALPNTTSQATRD